jgi:vancomycin permeability regulator SanA
MAASGRQRWLQGMGLALGGAVASFLAASLYVEVRYAGRIVPLEQVPDAPVGLVFGAGLAPGGAPSTVLAQRLDLGIALYRRGKVKRLLLSGDNTDRYHNETIVMRRYVLARGVPPQDVLADMAGVSTYDSCHRARNVFGVEQVTLVTQAFHLPRALFIANSLGMQAWGVAAGDSSRRLWRYEVRELASRALALGMVAARAPPRVEEGPTP